MTHRDAFERMVEELQKVLDEKTHNVHFFTNETGWSVKFEPLTDKE